MKSINLRTLAYRSMVLFLIGGSMSGFDSVIAQTKTWIGGTGNWDVSSNWSPSGIPVNSSIVLIYSGDVTIPSAYTATCMSVEVNLGAKFRILSSGELLINGSTNDGIRCYGLNSEITNDGIVRVGATTAISTRGIVLTSGGKFTNQSGALIEVNRISSENGMEIRDVNTKFTNYGNIQIGNLASIKYSCIFIHSAGQFENKPGGNMELNNTNLYHGLRISGTNAIFSNAGTLKIGNISPIINNGLTMDNNSKFHNLIGSILQIDRITSYDGLAISSNSTFYNSGQIQIGNNQAIRGRCIVMWSAGKLYNNASGSIELNRCTDYHGIRMNDSGTYLSNSGSIKIGNVAALNRSGLLMTSQSLMDNTSTGTLEINNTTVSEGITIDANAVINNSGFINIGNNNPIKRHGVLMASGAKFNNQFAGILQINRTATGNGIEIKDANTKFTNYGNIRIGNLASISNTCTYVHSGGQFENKPGGNMELNNTNLYHGIGIAGTNTVFSNAGILKIGNTNKINFFGLAVENGSTFNNLAGADVEIDSVASYDGLVITGNSIFNNLGHLKVGNNNSMGWRCLNMGSGGQLNNLSTGVIELNRTKNNWNAIELYNTGTKLINQGLIKIGNVAPILLSCIAMFSESQFENSSIGVLEMNNTVNGHGIHTRDLNTKFDNFGIVKMGFNRKIHDIGILMESGSKFNNYANATIEIDSIKNRDGICCTSASTVFENAGTIKIGKTYPISVHGITLSSAGCVFNNQTTGIMEVNRCWNGLNVIGAANFNNSGSIKIGNLAALQSDGIRLAGSGLSAFTNQISGVVEIDNVPNFFAVDPGSGTIVSNYGTFKIGINSQVFHGIGTSFGTAGSFNNYGSLEFKNILNNGIHSNQTLHNNPGATLSVPAAGKLQIANLGVLNNAAGAFVNNFGTLTNNGIINNSGTFDNQNIYKGTGAFNTSLFSNPAAGTVAPGLSPGCLQFTNGWASVGKLEIEINGPSPCSDYDQLQVTGNAQAGGDLHITFNYTPACGATFQLISATSHSGSFANIFITPNTMVGSYSDGLLSILDVVPPTITCPSNVNYTTTPGDCGPVPSSEISLGTPVTNDDCGVSGYSNNAPSNYPLGVKNITWTVTDLSGNTSTCIQKVTILAGSCGTPSQVIHTDITESSAKILWNAGVPCATNYQLRIRYELTPGVWSSWSSWTNPSGPGLEHLFTGLSANTLHHYQIRSKCGTTNSTSINGWFTTLTAFAGSEDRNRDDVTADYEYRPVKLEFIPNPASTTAQVLITGFDQHSKEVAMMDLLGKQVFCVQLKPDQNAIELDLNALKVQNGIFLVRVSDGYNQKTGQLIIGR
ncbi:MAG: hypothetical protein JPMHGGIA_01714 [Saprospiraceae bacterium]|nr:hypothetical protein [Saprospiraceae bacterium]